jgi:hypothetical protein
LILSDTFFRRRGMQWALIAVFALTFILALRAMLISGVFMGPAHRANKPAAPNAGIASRFAVAHHWPSVGEPGRSATFARA